MPRPLSTGALHVAAKGDLEGALKDYNEALRLKPDYAIAYHNRAVARRAKGDADGARQDDNDAIRLGYKA